MTDVPPRKPDLSRLDARALAEYKAMLRSHSAVLRLSLRLHGHALQQGPVWWRMGQVLWQRLRAEPAVPAALALAALGVLAWRRPGRSMRWVWRAWAWWRSAQQLQRYWRAWQSTWR